MRKEPATRLLHLAREFAAEHAGVSLDEIATRFAVSRRTAERMRDAVAEVFPQLEEVDDERPKRWRLPCGLSGIFREPLAEELAALRGIVRRLKREGSKESAGLLENVASKIEASLKPARRRTLAPDVEALLEAEGFVSRPGPRPIIAPQTFALIRQAILEGRRLASHTGRRSRRRRPFARSCPTACFTGSAFISSPPFHGKPSRSTTGSTA